MSARTDRDAQGELQGAIASSSALTAIVGPIVMAHIFDHFVDRQGVYLPGAPFLVAALLLALASFLLWRLTDARAMQPETA